MNSWVFILELLKQVPCCWHFRHPADCFGAAPKVLAALGICIKWRTSLSAQSRLRLWLILLARGPVALELVDEDVHFLDASVQPWLSNGCASGSYWTLMYNLLILDIWTHLLIRLHQIYLSYLILVQNRRPNGRIIW
jgi:cytochrome c oxidase assembly factor CtaG